MLPSWITKMVNVILAVSKTALLWQLFYCRSLWLYVTEVKIFSMNLFQSCRLKGFWWSQKILAIIVGNDIYKKWYKCDCWDRACSVKAGMGTDVQPSANLNFESLDENMETVGSWIVLGKIAKDCLYFDTLRSNRVETRLCKGRCLDFCLSPKNIQRYSFWIFIVYFKCNMLMTFLNTFNFCYKIYYIWNLVNRFCNNLKNEYTWIIDTCF